MLLHLDADAFYASVEQATDSRLRGRPIAVGGSKRGIVASASYEARRCGIRTAMPTVRARKLCPDLILLPGDYEKYEQFSRWMFAYAHDFSPTVEATSIDEGYVDLAGRRDAPDTAARRLQEAIRSGLRIDVSEGLARTKLVSQIASKLHKPAAFVTVAPEEELGFLHPLEAGWLPGIGPRASDRLAAAGLRRVAQLADTPVDHLRLLLGRRAERIADFAHGIDPRPVTPRQPGAKSYGAQETFAEDLTDLDLITAVVQHLADRNMTRVRRDGVCIRGVTVTVRYNDFAEDQRSRTLDEPVDDEVELYPLLRQLLREAWARRVSLRLVGVRFTHVYPARSQGELSLGPDYAVRDRRRALHQAVDELRRTRGADTVLRGHHLVLREHAATRGYRGRGKRDR